MKKKYINVIISFSALIFLAAHLFCPAIKFDYSALILFGLVLLPWILGNFEDVEFFGLFKAKVKLDESPDTYTPKLINLDKEEDDVIKRSEEKKLKIKATSSSQRFLQIKARINFPSEAGSSYVLKITVNDIIIDHSRLVNKPITKIYLDGREFGWYLDNHKSWNLQYSPSFTSNYQSSKYKVVNGDPYSYIFDISSIIANKDKEYIVKLFHSGLADRPAHQNYIVYREIKIL